jgi:serine-type D-Ala-D-Ala carboxypeptidase (penicillin-binding protein 5/6)
MKRKILIISFLLLFLFSPFVKIEGKKNLTSEERAVLIEQLLTLIKKISDLRWQLEKTDLEKEINALSYLVYDIKNNSIILGKNSTDPYPIASITKLVTAVVARENANIDQKITLTKEMFLLNSYQQPSPAIYPGTTVTLNDLIKASLIQSTNNAAESLANFLMKDKCVSLMNEITKKIGVEKTYFHDAHGLSPLNSSSAIDLAKLLTYIEKNHPEILEISKEENFQLPGNCPQHDLMCTFKNLNNFHQVDAFVGGKTGYTKAAGNTFAGVFQFRETPYAIVLLNTPSRTNDVQRISAWLERRP